MPDLPRGAYCARRDQRRTTGDTVFCRVCWGRLPDPVRNELHASLAACQGASRPSPHETAGKRYREAVTAAHRALSGAGTVA